MLLRKEPRPGRSSDFDQNALQELVEYNPCKTTLELAPDRNTSQSVAT